MNAQEKYIIRVCQTALYFFEMFEEKQDGDTRAIGLIKPTSKITNVKMRDFVLNDLYKSRGLSLTEAAVQLATWLSERDDTLAGSESIETALRAECAFYERGMRVVMNNEVIERSYIRLARYYRQMYAEDAGPHTRAPVYFIPPKYIPQSESHEHKRLGKTPSGEGEHVVPCAAIRDYCLRYFNDGRHIDEVVKLIRRLLVVVYTTPDEMKKFDTGRSGLKEKMPNEWDLETSCIFDRLHNKKIQFDVPVGLFCTCKP